MWKAAGAYKGQSIKKVHIKPRLTRESLQHYKASSTSTQQYLKGTFERVSAAQWTRGATSRGRAKGRACEQGWKE